MDRLKARRKRRKVEWEECRDPAPAIGTRIRTACGSEAEYSAETACVEWNGERIFFCLPACKVNFIEDPANSCLAERFDQSR